MVSLFARACNPFQYDLEDVSWHRSLSGSVSPTQASFWEFIEPHSDGWRGKSLLDVGAGTGWLLDLALKAGATKAIGIEPAAKNIEVALKLHPEISILQKTLEEYQPDSQYDTITAVYVFSHIADLNKGLEKISRILVQGGEFLAVVPDYDYNRLRRNGYEILYEELNEDEYVAKVKKPYGTIADIIRKVEKYMIAGLQYGLALVEDLPIRPTKRLLELEPRYNAVTDRVTTHLLRFIKRKV